MEARIAFIGDSYIAGTGDAHCLGWVGRLARTRWAAADTVSIYNLGIRGETTAMIASRWCAESEPRVGPHNFGRLVFSFGINDIAIDLANGTQLLVEAKSLAAAREMMSAASAWLPTLWVGPPPANEIMSPQSPLPGISFNFEQARLAALNARFSDLAGELGIPYLDISTPLAGHPDYLKSQATGDGMHCSGEGYAMIASLVEGWSAWDGFTAISHDERSRVLASPT